MLTADHDTRTAAADLGFLLPTGPITGPAPILSGEAEEAALQESIRQKALVHVDVLSEMLTRRALKPDSPAKTVVDALDANYRLSGLAGKNLPKDSGGGVTITINIPQLENTGPEKNLVIDAAASEVAFEMEIVPPDTDG